MSQDARDVVEHGQAEQAKRDHWTRQDAIRETIERCSRALGRGGDPHESGGAEYYHLIERACREGIGQRQPLVTLLRRAGGRPLLDYEGEAGGAFDYVALDRFLDGEPRGFTGRDPGSRELVRDAYRSLVAIAEAKGLVEDQLRNRADAVGVTLKLGEHLQEWGMDLGDPVEVVADQAGTLKTLFFGPTGNGKSTGLDIEAEDFYQQNFREGRDFKLIDPVGLRDGENWYYDVPQQQQPLRRIRQEMNLPPDFASGEGYGRPTIEILVPLVPGLTNRRLPYHVQGEEFVVRPYVAPASELSEALLVSLLGANISDQEQNTVRQAYRDVNEHRDDWSLKDIADAIRERDELQPKTKENAVGVLRNLQDIGFIRTQESEYTIDWRNLFLDTETVTVFSQALFNEDENLARLIAVAHIIDTILTERQQLFGAPEAVLCMRELWKITPHKGRQKDDDVLASIQETIGSRLTTIQRENRHYGVHFLGDTQWPSDLHISVRKNFNRYVAYGGNRNIIGKVFEWTANAKVDSFYGTLTPERGKAGIVGQVQPAIDKKEIEYISPVQYAPPSYHHKDKDVDDNGWRSRAKYFSPIETCENDLCGSTELYRPKGRPYALCTECLHTMRDLSLGRTEELRRPADVESVDWPDEIPPELTIGVQVPNDSADRADPQTSPVAAFVHQCLQPSSDYTTKADIQSAFNAFLRAHDKDPWDFDDHGKRVRFGTRAADAADWPLETSQRNDEKVYLDSSFTQLGRKYLDDATEAAIEAE